MSEWQQTTLGAICAASGGAIQTGPFGSQLHASDYVASGIPSVMPQNIGDNHIIEDGIARITEDDAIRLTKYRLSTNDIVYSRRGDVERRALVKPENDGWLCGTGCLKVSFGNTPAVDPTFISYVLGTHECRDWLVRHAVGATMLSINTKILQSLPLRIPSFPTQRAIAEVLSAFDDKIASNVKFAETLAAMATAQFDQCMESARNSVPLNELVTTQYGITTSSHDGPGPRFLRVTDINKKPWIEWATTPYCTVNNTELAKYRVNPGDILVARMADPGKAAFIDQGDPEAVFASYLIRLRALHPNQALFIYYFLRSNTYQNYAEGAMQGSAQQNMNAKVIVATDISVPESDALDKFNSVVSTLRIQTQSVQRENLKLAEIRDELLHELMSGKLRVKDAETIVESVV